MTAPARWKVAFAAGVLIVLAIAYRGPVSVPDTESYVTGSALRPPLVFTVWSGARVFGEHLQPHVFSLIQGLAALVSVAYLAVQTTRLVACQPKADVALAALLFVPQVQAIGTIASESLAYSAFCGCVGAWFRVVGGGISSRACGLALLCAGLAYEARPQFVYLLALSVIGCVVCGVLCRSRPTRLRIASFSAAALLVVFGIQAVYFFPRTGRISGQSTAGVELITVVAHLAADNDIDALAPGVERDFARRVHARMKRLGLTADAPHRMIASWHFGAAYNPIIGQVLAEYNDSFTHKQLHFPPEPGGTASGCGAELYCPAADDNNPRPVVQSALSLDDWRNLNDVTTRVARSLLPRVAGRYATFALRMIFEHAHLWIFVAAAAMVAGTMSIAFKAHHIDRGAGFALGAAGCLWWVNALLVAAVEVVQTRYLFYTDELLLTVVVAVGLRGLWSSRNEPNRALAAVRL